MYPRPTGLLPAKGCIREAPSYEAKDGNKSTLLTVNYGIVGGDMKVMTVYVAINNLM